MASNWKPLWVRGGIVDDMVWVGKDVLAWCSGLYIVFFDFQNNSELFRWCYKQSTGEGACCISGHATLPLFAFAEKITNPRVLVYTFPNMIKVSECLRGGPNGYLSTAFTENEYLVTLSSFPNFPVTIWSWRNGEKLAMVHTQIMDVDQKLKLTSSGQTFISQLSKTYGKISIWEMNVCGKIVTLKDNEVVLPKAGFPVVAKWCPEPGPPLLAIVDREGHVYLSNSDASNVHRIVLSQRCSECVDFEIPNIVWFRGGIVLKTTFCQVRYYKKNEHNQWHMAWHLKPPAHPRILTAHPFRIDRFFCYTHEGTLLEFDYPEGQALPLMILRIQYGAMYKYVNWLYPWGHHVMGIDNAKQLSVVDTYTGTEISRIDLEMIGAVSRLVPHPDYPMAAVTSKMGEFVLISLIDPDEPKILMAYRLQREDLDLLKFSYSGKYVAAGASKAGTCFCIGCERSKPFKVVARLEAKRQLADLALYDYHGHLKLFVLYVTSKQAALGHQILLYDLPPGQSRFTDASYILELLTGFQSLRYSPGSITQLVATPYLSRQLHVLGIVGWKEVNLMDAMPTGHQVRQCKIYTDRRWVTTSGMDGSVVVRSGKKIRNCVAVLVTHHRQDFGAVKCIMKSSGDIVVSLGYNGSLVATKLYKGEELSDTGVPDTYHMNIEERSRRRRKFHDYTTFDAPLIDLLNRHRQEFAPLAERQGKTWLEWRKQKKLHDEAREYAHRRAGVQADFAVLKAGLVKLLNANEICPDIERLPLSAFDLDKVVREQKLKAAKDEREDVRLELESNRIAMDRVSSWIKATFWDPNLVEGQSIFSITGTNEVTNYTLHQRHPSVGDLYKWAQFSREVVRGMLEGDTFCPWIPYTQDELESQLQNEARLSTLDEKQRIDALLAEDNEEETEPDPYEIENQRALEGMTTYRFIEQSSQFFTQFELYSFGHKLIENRILVNETHSLRVYFNKLFADMYAAKEREMSLVNERNERIRYIDSELRLMFEQTVPEMPVDPEWNQKEKPEMIIKVFDYEVKERPYISPSQQEILDKQAAEAERIRLMLLADDFRERAVMAMMDGVLEVRWEDVIKKDITKPLCMQIKQPENYTAEDILTVQQYDRDVEFLMHERERYRRILETDFLKVSGVLKEGIDKFKSKVEDFFLIKMRVEAAIQQLNLRLIRGSMRIMYRVDMIKSDDQFLEKIADKQKQVAYLTEELQHLQSMVTEMRTQYETLCNREKMQEKKFKVEFPGLGKGSLEILQRQYKRRPRMAQKAMAAYHLQEIGKSAVTLIKPVYLPADCIDYLKGMDVLDTRPNTLPASIDAAHWEHLVRVRRHKVDIEMRIKAIVLEIAEADHTVSDYVKKIAKAKSEVDNLKDQLVKLRQDKILFDQDIEVQFVLKMGQVEIFPKSHRDDMANTIFIPRQEIEDVNTVILAAGAEKLKAMNRTINFRRGILCKEWEHKALKMRIEDLKEELYCIENVVVTREIQVYLKRKARGFKDDKTPQQLERELAAMRRSFEKLLRDWVEKLEDVEARIVAIKKSNYILDRRITEQNVVRYELEFRRDLPAEDREHVYFEQKMNILVHRSNLIKKLQDNYGELLVLQTEHELLRLRRYPALKFFKTLHDEPGKRHEC